MSSDSPAQLEPPVETTGTHTVGRTTQDDHAESSPNSLLDVVRALVDRVALRLRDVDLLAPVPPSLGERIDGLLQEAWTEVSEGRDFPAGVAADRAIELARCELVEHGPLTELIADPTVSEVGVTRFDRVLSVRGGRSVTETGFSSDLSLRWAVSRLCAEADAPLLPSEEVIERRIMPGVRLSASARFDRGERGLRGHSQDEALLDHAWKSSCVAAPSRARWPLSSSNAWPRA